jgi:hypothetical protein
VKRGDSFEGQPANARGARCDQGRVRAMILHSSTNTLLRAGASRWSRARSRSSSVIYAMLVLCKSENTKYLQVLDGTPNVM